MQYIHGLAARGVHYLHRPGPMLQDIGFLIFPVSKMPFDSEEFFLSYIMDMA